MASERLERHIAECKAKVNRQIFGMAIGALDTFDKALGETKKEEKP